MRPLAALAERFLELGWIKRAPVGRAVALTATGHTGLAEILAVEIGCPCKS